VGGGRGSGEGIEGAGGTGNFKHQTPNINEPSNARQLNTFILPAEASFKIQHSSFVLALTGGTKLKKICT
jgi:hypothetical protein